MWDTIKKILILPWVALLSLITVWFCLGLFLLGVGVLIVIGVMISAAF